MSSTWYGALKIMTSKHIKSLYVFDIDDTLFQTTAKAKVTNSKGEVKFLNSEELKDFKIKDDETICFAEFKDSKKFVNESQPIKPIINGKMKLKNSGKNDVIFIWKKAPKKTSKIEIKNKLEPMYK